MLLTNENKKTVGSLRMQFLWIQARKGKVSSTLFILLNPLAPEAWPVILQRIWNKGRQEKGENGGGERRIE